jgi:hypothetical protein
MKKWIALTSLALACSLSFAQDTITVQTFDFNDITKRRGVYEFPSDTNEFRKIIMEMTLKCDARTTQDRFDCGEWDYLTYTYVYDHRGILDSTYQSGPAFRLAGQTPETLLTLNSAPCDYWGETAYRLNKGTVFNSASATVGTGNVTSYIGGSERAQRFQWLWKASELSAAGLSAGDITSLSVYVDAGMAPIVRFEIKMGHTSDTVLVENQAHTGLQSHYLDFGNLDQGSGGKMNTFDLNKPFSWNGVDNIVIEVLADNTDNFLNPFTAHIEGDTLGFTSSLFWRALDYSLDFQGGQQYIDLGRFTELDGNSSKTIEAWARTERFNNAGIFQAGQTGSTGRDFSLRTTTTDNQWRVQHWGGPDYDVTVPNSMDEWHHYAVTYNGSTSKLFVDGIQVGSENSNLNTGTSTMKVARWQGNYFNGKIDELRVWKAALTPSALSDYMYKEVDSTHPNHADLLADYNFNEGQGSEVIDGSASSRGASTIANNPAWYRHRAYEHHGGMEASNWRPKLTFHQDSFASTIDTAFLYIDTVCRPPLQVVRYGNPANGVQIADNDPNHPSLPTDTLYTWKGDVYSFTYDRVTGQKIDSVFHASTGSEVNSTKEWYTPFARFEIGRFITPYGIGLDLGPDGFTWYYDVTDYAPLLVDSVDISTGNQQELVDLKFHMIKGEPTREVVGINRVWGQNRSYSYRNLDDDVSLSEQTLDIMPGTESWKVRTRITGHGHNSDNGQFPHCCEWKDNEHYLYVDGTNVGLWHIWQTHDCALNPVYPQGGTWPGAREGWCPGDVVKNFDFEIEDFVSGTEVKLDYDITPVPSNNQGMGSGNYQMAFHMFQYGPYKSENDAEIVEVISPSNKAYYSRQSLLCQNPSVILRNNGSETLRKVNIYYKVSGGTEWVEPWFGTLEPNESTRVELDVTGPGFWTGDGQNIFSARVEGPNGKLDEYTDNDVLSLPMSIPDHYTDKVVVSLTTNLAASENALKVTDMSGNVVIDWSSLSNSQTLTDTVQGANGCFVLEMTDSQDDGLSYWARPSQGSGALRLFILDANNVIVGIKAFEPEFGHRLRYNFTVGPQSIGQFSKADTGAGPGTTPWVGIEQFNPSGIQEVFLSPNPVSNSLQVELIGAEGEMRIELMDLNGKRLKSMSRFSESNYQITDVDVTDLASGIYLLKVEGKNFREVRKFTKN